MVWRRTTKLVSLGLITRIALQLAPRRACSTARRRRARGDRRGRGTTAAVERQDLAREVSDGFLRPRDEAAQQQQERRDERERDFTYDGKHYGFPLKEAVWRTNHGYDPKFLQDALTTHPGTDSFNRYLLLHDTFAWFVPQ